MCDDSPSPGPAEPGEVDGPAAGRDVILLRGGASSRCCWCSATPAARFMGGAWVFPGGAVDEDGEGETALRAAAVRELPRRPGSPSLATPSWSRSRAGSRRAR